MSYITNRDMSAAMDSNLMKEFVSKSNYLELELPVLTALAPLLDSILLGIRELDEVVSTDSIPAFYTSEVTPE